MRKRLLAAMEIPVACALTYFLVGKVYEKKIKQLRDDHGRELEIRHSNTFNYAWESSKGMYNRHPHLYCETCVEQRAAKK